MRLNTQSPHTLGHLYWLALATLEQIATAPKSAFFFKWAQSPAWHQPGASHRGPPHVIYRKVQRIQKDPGGAVSGLSLIMTPPFSILLMVFLTIHSVSSQRTVAYDVGASCRFAEYTLVSYCIELGGHGVPSWDCTACKRYFPEVDNANLAVFKTGFLDHDIHAFVAYNPTVPEIIVAFEG